MGECHHPQLLWTEQITPPSPALLISSLIAELLFCFLRVCQVFFLWKNGDEFIFCGFEMNGKGESGINISSFLVASIYFDRGGRSRKRKRKWERAVKSVSWWWNSWLVPDQKSLMAVQLLIGFVKLVLSPRNYHNKKYVTIPLPY